jgi:O-antigen/teichoic acid export membrane protein
MRRILGNLGLLLRGRGIAGVMLLIATALMARALGPAEFGLVVLTHTYIVLVRGLFNVKQYLAIVRWGVPALDTGNIGAVRRLIRICWRLDGLNCIAATAAAFALAPLIGPYLGMDQDQVNMLTLYSLVLLTTGNRTAVGILRLFDKFDILGRKETIGPGIQLLGVTIAWWLECPMSVFIGVYAFSFVAGELYLTYFGHREYRREIAHAPEEEQPKRARMAEFPGLRQFLWITYWQSNVDLIPKHGSIMLAGVLLGPSDAGLLRLARQLSTTLSKPAGLIRQVIFPDLTRSWNQGNKDFGKIVFRTSALAGSVGLLFVVVGYLGGEFLLDRLVGESFVAAAPVLTLLLLASTFDLTAASLRSAAYAIGHAAKVLRLYALSAVIYLLLFFVCTMQLGLVGSGVAAALAAAIPPLAMAFMIRRDTR